MTAAELRAVLDRYPELRSGLPEHINAVVRIAGRILDSEQHSPQRPELSPEAPGVGARLLGATKLPDLRKRGAEHLVHARRTGSQN
jgi:hypothetical protein